MTDAQKIAGSELTLSPHDIERRSFEIITEELGDRELDPLHEPIIKRVIHTSADFSYADNLYFSPGAVEKAVKAIREGATFVFDTNMGLSGITKPGLAKLGCQAVCFMADPEVAELAKANGTTRAVACIDKAAELEGPVIFAIGNAPTALMRIDELIKEGRLDPALVIGVPVGFVNVVESKERIIENGVPCIVARGRKGGSNIAAAICNALIYSITRAEGISVCGSKSNE